VQSIYGKSFRRVCAVCYQETRLTRPQHHNGYPASKREVISIADMGVCTLRVVTARDVLPRCCRCCCTQTSVSSDWPANRREALQHAVVQQPCAFPQCDESLWSVPCQLGKSGDTAMTSYRASSARLYKRRKRYRSPHSPGHLDLPSLPTYLTAPFIARFFACNACRAASLVSTALRGQAAKLGGGQKKRPPGFSWTASPLLPKTLES
jgi:hypothetical protein